MKNSGVTVDEWVAAGTEIRELAYKMIYGKTIDLGDGSLWQPKVFAAALLGRSMMAQKCALILAQAGMVTGCSATALMAGPRQQDGRSLRGATMA